MATERSVHWTVDQAVQGCTILTEIIVFNFPGQDNVISQCRSTTRTISNYNVPAKYMLGGSRNTPSCPMLQKLEINAELVDHNVLFTSQLKKPKPCITL